MTRRTTSPKRTLPLPIRNVLEEPFDEQAIAGLLARRRQPRPTAGAKRFVWVPLALAAAMFLAWLTWPTSGGPIRLAHGPVLDGHLGAGIAQTVDLDDGSSLEFEQDSSLSTLSNDGEEIVLLLDEGTVTFDVQPHGPRRWTIECGLATVVVVGTRFTIERTPERLVVSVERGHVLVRGELVPDRVRSLRSGERIELASEVAELPAPPASIDTELPSDTGAVSPLEAPAPSRARWRTLAEAREWADAYEALGPGDAEQITERGGVSELLALADVARLSGHPSEAIAPLSRIVFEHASDPNAGLAAFSLGRIEDQLGHPAQAARAFGHALRIGLPGALTGDALAREALALDAAGEDAAARAAAGRYLERLPDGPHAAEMRSVGASP